MANPQVVVEYVAKVDKLAKASDQVGFAATKAGKLTRKAFLPAVATLGLIAVGSLKAADAASALNEQITASEVVFGNQARSVQDWSKTSAKAFGLSRREALTAANAYGNMFSTVGLGAKDVAVMSKRFVGLAGDMASFHDQDPTDMLDRLRSGLSGEAEPLRRFGVLLSEARVKATAYRLGIAKSGATLTEAQKVQARYALILEDTQKAQGNFAKTSDDVANAQRTAAAQTENLQAQFGKALLPVLKAVLGVASTLMGWLGRYPGVLTAVVAAVAALTVAVIAMNVAMAVAAVVASPVALTFLAIAAAVAAVVVIVLLLIRYWDTIVSALQAGWQAITRAAQTAFGWIKSNWPLLVAILAGPFGIAVALIVRYWSNLKDAASSAVGFVRSVLGSLAGWIVGIARQIVAPLGWIDDALMGIAHAAQSMFGLVKVAINGLVSFLQGIVGSVRGAANAIAGAIKAPINAVLSAWNSLAIPRVAISLPKIRIAGKTIYGGGSYGFGPFNFPDIPMLAKGGVITSPTLAMLGEGRGREIAAPESLLRSIVAESGPTDVRVFIGDTELRSMIRYEIRRADDRTAQVLLSGLR